MDNMAGRLKAQTTKCVTRPGTPVERKTEATSVVVLFSLSAAVNRIISHVAVAIFCYNFPFPEATSVGISTSMQSTGVLARL